MFYYVRRTTERSDRTPEVINSKLLLACGFFNRSNRVHAAFYREHNLLVMTIPDFEQHVETHSASVTPGVLSDRYVANVVFNENE